MSILGLGGVSLPNLGTSLFIRPRSQAAFGTAPIDRRASIAEVNATPTSCGPFSPTISGSSTDTPIRDGIYSGAQGDDVLTFKFKRNRTVGEANSTSRSGGAPAPRSMRSPSAAGTSPASRSP